MYDMINLIFALVVSVLYVMISFSFARGAYRREYNLIYGSPAPQIYGGKNGHDRAHKYALSEAFQWLGLWPLFLIWEGISQLIAHGVRQGWVESDNKITRMQEEVDRLAAEQDPLKDLDPLRRFTESVMHAIEQPDPWLWGEEPEIILTPHPEKIRVIKIGPCVSCRAVAIFNDKLFDGSSVDPELGDIMSKPCTCGRHEIKNLGRLG